MAYSTDGVREELVLVTPDMARELVEATLYERQRAISEQHVERLSLEMRREQFIAGTQVHFAELRKNLYCINGNHTLRAVIKANITVPLCFLYSTCRNETEIAELYARHDIHRARNWAASFKAHAIFADMEGNAAFVTSVGAALRYILTGLDKEVFHSDHEAAYSRDLRIKAMKEYRAHAEMLLGALSSGSPRTRKMLLRSAALAVALETVRFQPAGAIEFWSGCAEDDGLHKGDPRKTLLHWLAENKGRGNQGVPTAIRATTLAWNAWYEDRKLTSLRPSVVTEYHLAGTPWKDGKRADMLCLRPPAQASRLIKMGRQIGPNGQERAVAIAG